MADLYDELEFPQRAEYLDQYKNYQVDIAHWKPLAEQFQKAFRRVHARRSAAVLLVHGPQGSGKSMFCNRLEQDYKRSREGAFAPDLRNNLWHVLVTTDQRNDEATIRDATMETTLTLVDDGKAEWLKELKAVAKADKSSRVRVFLCDDAHKDSKVRPWTDLAAKEFYEAKQAGPDALLAHVAERINEGCRGEFQRSLFVMLSNDKRWVDSLRSKLDVWYKELATDLTLPVPDPPTLERIVRINTNRLNRVSYSALKPDLIVEDPDSLGHGEYKICSLTAALSDDDKSIADAIRRTGHSIEFTAFLRERLEGLEDYLRDKVECYAAMLESV
jgi:hypothetical protein